VNVGVPDQSYTSLKTRPDDTCTKYSAKISQTKPSDCVGVGLIGFV